MKFAHLYSCKWVFSGVIESVLLKILFGGGGEAPDPSSQMRYEENVVVSS